MKLEREEINRREVYRYMGYRGQIPDENICSIVEEIIDTLVSKVQPKYLYKRYYCKTEADKIVFSSNEQVEELFTLRSHNLAMNLKDCDEVLIVVATLGIEADKVLQRYEVTNMAKAAIAQACGAACIEAFCDRLQEDIRKKEEESQRYLHPRFSPGYGDLPLETQKIIFSQLECTKRMGVTLTEDLLMYPTKSVSAFIGITKNRQECHIGKCKSCANTECEFRNEDS